MRPGALDENPLFNADISSVLVCRVINQHLVDSIQDVGGTGSLHFPPRYKAYLSVVLPPDAGCVGVKRALQPPLDLTGVTLCVSLLGVVHRGAWWLSRWVGGRMVAAFGCSGRWAGFVGFG